MIDNYKIKINNNEEILYLYINYNYEFGNFENKKYGIINNIKNYIREHKINFNGNKIKLVISGIVLCTIILNHNNFNKYENNNLHKRYSYISSVIFDDDFKINKNYNQEFIDNNDNIEEIRLEDKIVVEDMKDIKKNVNNKPNISNQIQNNNNNLPNIENVVDIENLDQVITMYKTNGEIIQISMDDYLIGVVSAEMPASFNIEALKTQAIISRTYTMKLIERNKNITDNSQTQNYKTIDELKSYWGNDFNTYYNKIKKAVEETKNKVVKYNNELIDAVFHSTSNGYTEDPINVWGNNIPYLKQVNSEFDMSATPYYRETNYSYEQLNNILGINVNIDTNIVIYKNNSNRVSTIYLDGIAFNGVNFRNLLGLRSADFEIVKNEFDVTIITRGYGHGVGLSQYGANYLANNGYNYEQIIKYYYQNVDISFN